MATTEQLMEQYGVAWFGFDEMSGNVTDKLGGNYTGIVTGATRVIGWDGEGKAIKFNGGTEYVTFNNPIIPNDEFTLKLKFKVYSQGSNIQYLLTTQTQGASDKGLRVAYSSNTLYVFIANGTYIVRFTDTIQENQWYDLLINLSNSNKMCEIYLNEKLVNKIDLISNFTGNGANMLLSRSSPSSTNNFAKAEIDDLQIFSKALTPYDFIQKRVAFRTTDNKILTLPTKVGRVKEIPSTDEVDLVKQGYTWREIDDAVDAQVIDLTQPTTEYEKVSNTYTPVGDNKVFTIPLNDSFKTIKIEGNY